MTGYIGRFRIDLFLFFSLLSPAVNQSLCLVEANTEYIANFKIAQLVRSSLFKQLFEKMCKLALPC